LAALLAKQKNVRCSSGRQKVYDKTNNGNYCQGSGILYADLTHNSGCPQSLLAAHLRPDTGKYSDLSSAFLVNARNAVFAPSQGLNLPQ